MVLDGSNPPNPALWGGSLAGWSRSTARRGPKVVADGVHARGAEEGGTQCIHGGAVLRQEGLITPEQT